MYSYLLYGSVLPERAQLTLQCELNFTHVSSGVDGNAKVSIILNQIAVTITTAQNWDVHDLRNTVANILRNQLSMVGYLTGHAYDFEITRIISADGGIDYVFGIDMPCIATRRGTADIVAALTDLRRKNSGPHGIFLHRSFADLVSALKDADDTGFYCYRAIEALRNHCASANGLLDANRSIQWSKFREIAGCDEDAILAIKTRADLLRHGGVTGLSSDDRADILTRTWDIVDAYLAGV
jgi:hypothetical protein